VGQLGRRQAVLFSLIAHLMIVSVLANRTRTEIVPPKPQVSPTPPPRLVYFPPAARRQPAPPPTTLVPRTPLDRLQPTPPPPAVPPPQARPRELYLPRPEEAVSPPPTTVPTRMKDKISVGTATGTERQFVAPREGTPGPPKDGRPGGPATPPPPEATGADQAGSETAQGIRRQRAGRGVGENPVVPEERSIAGSLRRLETRRLGDLTPTGEGGAVRQMGPLIFDDQGADFTAWINHWRTEVYRNWIVPQAVLYGFRSGHVDFEFTVERDGTMSALRMLKSSGVGALDRAAENALRGSRYLPLPGDYRPPRLTLQVTFLYNETPPQGS
jgi:protein TonB